MLWLKSRPFLLLLVALFCFSSVPCWAEDVTLTAEQWQTLKAELDNLKIQIKTADSELMKSREALTESKAKLMKAQAQLAELQTQLTVQSDLLEALSKSSATLNRDLWIDRLIWFGVGSAAGFIGGNYTGIKIGVSLQY